ncbi:MAG: DUF4097 family beta strand repeat-containing protein [Gemmatimonadaceae bacterium]
MRRLLLPAALCATPLAAQQTERVALPGSDVAVYNLVGTVRVVGSGGGAGGAVAEVRRGGPDGAKLRIEAGPIGGRQALRVIYPATSILARDMGRWSTTRLRVRDDGTFGDGDRGRPDGEPVSIGGGGVLGRGLEARADVTLHVPAGARVLVHLAVGDATVTNVEGEVRVDVEAARVAASGIRGRLSVEAGSREARVGDVEGELEIDAGSGDVIVSRIRGRSMVVDAGPGTLEGRDIAVDRLDLDLGAGRARLSDVSAAEISLDAGSGPVELGLSGDVSALDVDSGSGTVTIGIPPSLGAMVEVDAGAGGVASQVPMTITRRTRSELSGRIGDGKGRIRVDAGSGRVLFRKS